MTIRWNCSCRYLVPDPRSGTFTTNPDGHLLPSGPVLAFSHESTMSNSNDLIQVGFSPAQLSLVRASVETYRELMRSDTSADREALGHAWADAEVTACDVLLQTQLKDIPLHPPSAATDTPSKCDGAHGHPLLESTITFLALLNQADSVTVNQQLLQHWETADPTTNGENQVVRFSWYSEGVNFAVALTQDGIANGRWHNGFFICMDSEGDTLEIWLAKHSAITPPSGAATS